MKSVRSSAQIKDFIKLPFIIYKDNKNWVPPLNTDIKRSICSKNINIKKNFHEAFLVYQNKKPVARIYLGFNEELNKKKGKRTGYFSLFECINNQDVCQFLFDFVGKWFRKRNINFIRGPLSVTGAEGDDYKGLLIDCFDKPPLIMNSYNPEYYKSLLSNAKLVKDYDIYAYYLDGEKLFKENTRKIINYAMKKYKFRIENINLKNIERESVDIKYILDHAVPDEWPDLIPPSLEDVKKTALNLKKYADKDIIFIARDEFRPIGFGIALPDYNQVLIHLKGKLNIFSFVKYLYYKRKINAARMFIIFVIPEYRKKGVSYALYYSIFSSSISKGYINGEGSTIGEDNVQMRKDVETLGGVKYKTYRVFKLEI